MNLEGQISSGEHCFVSDHDMVKKKFCLDYQGIWNPVGEWKYETVRDEIIFQLDFNRLFLFYKRIKNKFTAQKRRNA